MFRNYWAGPGICAYICVFCFVWCNKQKIERKRLFWLIVIGMQHFVLIMMNDEPPWWMYHFFISVFTILFYVYFISNPMLSCLYDFFLSSFSIKSRRSDPALNVQKLLLLLILFCIFVIYTLWTLLLVSIYRSLTIWAKNYNHIIFCWQTHSPIDEIEKWWK